MGLSKKYIPSSYQPFPEEFLSAATAKSPQHLCPIFSLASVFVSGSRRQAPRALLLCVCPFLAGDPAPEAARGSRSWGRSLCVSARPELRRWGTCSRRSSRRRGQELQIDWFPSRSEPVLCLESGERGSVISGGQKVRNSIPASVVVSVS